MWCKGMLELKDFEIEMRNRCRASKDYFVQMAYGQSCLEAQRLQRFHFERCEECQDAEKGRAA